MTVRHMQIFIEVYRKVSITKAAETLHMTQPAVTHAIQEIERYYGVRLFDRLNRRLYITESGHSLYAYALHIADTFDMMEKTLLNWEARGIVRVGASVTIGNDRFPSQAKQFQEDNPGIRIKVTIANGSQLEQMLVDNELDFALIEGDIRQIDLISETYSEDRLSIIVPPGHPLLTVTNPSLSDLTPYDLLLRESSSAGRIFLEGIFAANGLSLRAQWESVSTQALIRAVSAGLGISILPYPLVREAAKKGEIAICPIEKVPLRRPLSVVWHRNKYLTPTAKRFIELCKSWTDA